MMYDAQQRYTNWAEYEEAENALNLQAYERALKAGKLDNLKGQWVVYFDGELFACAGTREGVLEQLTKEIFGSLIRQVGVCP